MAAAAYNKAVPYSTPPGWVQVGPPYVDDRHTGYFARLYRRVAPPVEWVLAYAGTDDWPNWRTNFTQGFGYGGIEYEIALEDAEDAINNRVPPGEPLRFVGHSLGGGLATAAAAVYHRRATTFNAAGVHDYTVQMHGANLININRLVDAYRIQGEVLSTIQDSSSVLGLLMPDGDGTPYWLPATSSDPIRRHFMDDVLAGFDKL